MRIQVRRLGVIVTGMMLVASVGVAEAGVAESLSPELRARGGLCVLIGGVDDVEAAEALLQSGPWVIHCLDADASAVEQARRALQERGLYGRIVVEHWTADHLPYADNLVNVIIVNDAEQPVDRDQLLRVLVPEGSAFFAEGERLDKPRPDEMGQWTHPWHDSDGSLASSDRAFDVPNAFQWIAGPPFPLAHRKNSAGVILSAGGRTYLITQNVPENVGESGPNYLVARDAFNGKVLWSRLWEGPLSRGHADAVHEAIVASADRVYGARDEEVAVFDAATGDVVETWPTQGTPDKLLLSDGVLIAQTPGGLTAFDVADGSQAWHYEADAPWGTVARDGRVFCLSVTRERDGRWLHELLAVHLRTGEEIWRQPTESEHGARGTAVLRLNFAGDGIVCLIERHELRVLSAEDGRELWRRRSQTEARGSGSMDSRQVGHFFVHGMVWMRMDRGSGREGPEPWLALDPLTGEVQREVDAVGPKGVIGNVNKVSCQPLTATERFVFDARLSTVWDFETGRRGGWKFVRGGCQVGMVPANGLAYVPPNACGCVGEQLRGTLAIVHTDDPGLESFVDAPLQRGPAYGETKPEDGGNASAWPTYRQDGRRGAYLPDSISAKLQPRWQTPVASEAVDDDGEWRLQFGRPLTPPVVADGLVVLAEPQTHQVIALDEESGAERWRFTAGGRVTVPPTLHGGLALFGAHDGYVYALRAADGELAWRFRAAPSDRRIMAYGQVESAWPVTGGVLVHQGLALVAAGRATDGDGGVVAHAIDPDSGEVQWTSRVQEALHGKGDLLVSDGEHVYLMNKRLDLETGEVVDIDFGTTTIVREWQDEARLQRVRYPEGIRYLRSGQAGFSNTSWTRLAMGLRKHQSSWTWGESEGELLAFTDDTGFAFQIDAGGSMWSSPRTNGGGRIKAWAESEEPLWSVELPAPAQVEAMLTTAEALFIAGPDDRAEPEGPAFLRAIGHETGQEQANIALPIAPVHDGIAAANGSVFATLRDGSVISLGPE